MGNEDDRVNANTENSSVDHSHWARSLSLLSQIGVTIIACVVIGVFLGRFLDGLFNTSPWLLLIFTLLGAAAAFKSILELSKKV